MTQKQHQSLSRAGLLAAGGTVKVYRKRLTGVGKASLVILSVILSLALWLVVEKTLTNSLETEMATQDANK